MKFLSYFFLTQLKMIVILKKIINVSDTLNSCTTKFRHQVFIIQWTFMLASSILAYFYVGDLVQGITFKSKYYFTYIPII